MKKPTAKQWLAIVGAALAVILTVLGIIADGVFTKAEAEDLAAKTGTLIETVQSAVTEEPAPAALPAEPEARP